MGLPVSTPDLHLELQLQTDGRAGRSQLRTVVVLSVRTRSLGFWHRGKLVRQVGRRRPSFAAYESGHVQFQKSQ